MASAELLPGSNCLPVTPASTISFEQMLEVAPQPRGGTRSAMRASIRRFRVDECVAELRGRGRVPQRGSSGRARGQRDPPGAARLTGIRVAVPVESLEARLAGLPEGLTVEAGRIEVRSAGEKEVVVKLFALAQALTGDYGR